MSDEPKQEGEPPAPKANFARARNVAKGNPAPTGSPQRGLGVEAFQRLISPGGVTPDQGCLAIIVGATLLIGSLAFWLFYYYQHAQEFQPAGVRQGPPPAQIEREREAARQSRLNRQ